MSGSAMGPPASLDTKPAETLPDAPCDPSPFVQRASMKEHRQGFPGPGSPDVHQNGVGTQLLKHPFPAPSETLRGKRDVPPA